MCLAELLTPLGICLAGCKSHCAVERPRPGLPEQDQWEGLTIPMLKHELEKRGLPTKGIKRTLVARLREAPPTAKVAPGLGVQPGIAAIGSIASREVGYFAGFFAHFFVIGLCLSISLNILFPLTQHKHSKPS